MFVPCASDAPTMTGWNPGAPGAARVTCRLQCFPSGGPQRRTTCSCCSWPEVGQYAGAAPRRTPRRSWVTDLHGGRGRLVWLGFDIRIYTLGSRSLCIEDIEEVFHPDDSHVIKPRVKYYSRN